MQRRRKNMWTDSYDRDDSIMLEIFRQTMTRRVVPICDVYEILGMYGKSVWVHVTRC